MKKFPFLFLFILAFSSPALSAVEESYTHEEPLAVTPWYGKPSAEQKAADLEFIRGMRPHHAGALTMSEEYLQDPEAENAQLKQLARGIIHNQKFEIGMLDNLEALANRPDDSSFKQVATRKLAQQQRFFKAPMPGPLDAWAGSKNVSKRDVGFAKAMIIHHEGALMMADEYLKNPAAENGYLELMCLDILVDQKQEIDFMKSILAKYSGDVAAIKPSAIYGMEHMNHSKHSMEQTQPAAHKH